MSRTPSHGFRLVGQLDDVAVLSRESFSSQTLLSTAALHFIAEAVANGATAL